MTRLRRTLKIGRVCLMNYGPYNGKLFAIINILDLNRVLGCGPNVPRDVYSVKQMTMTDLSIEFPVDCRDKIVLEAWKKADVDAAFGKTAWSKKIQTRKVRASLNDFDRFKRSKLLRKVSAKPKAAAKPVEAKKEAKVKGKK